MSQAQVINTAEATEVEEVRQPRVGDSVAITYVTDGNGKVVGKNDTATISAIYLDGTVRIGNGDVYKIERAAGGKCIWRTVPPKKAGGRQKVQAA